MRSDREEIPEGFTKADADKAETMEAALATREAQTGMRAMAAPGCQVYWPAPYEVCGAIRDKYNALGGPNSFLLLPKTNEITNPDGIGRRTEFQNGPIYWSPQGGAHPVVNHFLAAWARHGYENSYIGYPTSDEILNPDGIGRRQQFTGSTIYWRLNEAYSIGGAIADRWHQLGAERADGLLGYPISDERILPDGVGRMNRFERGVIYWHPTTGAHEIVGEILDYWSAEGFENSRYGYPDGTPEYRPDGSFFQIFQNYDIEGPIATALASYICTEVAARLADERAISDNYRFLCTPFGIYVGLPGGAAQFARPKQEEMRSRTQARAAAGEGCVAGGEDSISRPIREDRRVARTIDTCYGGTNSVTGQVENNPLSYTISNWLKERQYHHVSLQINTTDAPSDLNVTAYWRVREDIPRAFDDTLAEGELQAWPGGGMVSDGYEIGTNDGTFFAEMLQFKYDIPSLDLKGIPPGVFKVKIGRFTCPPYSGTGPGDLCTWPPEGAIDTH